MNIKSCTLDIEGKKRRLLAILKERSYREGEFTLTSGKKSRYYIDCKVTTLWPEGAWLAGCLLFHALMTRGEPVDAVGGMTLGADPLVTSVSVIGFLQGAQLPALIVRKEPKGHGTGAWIEGLENVKPGARVALLEDVVTTGGTLIQAARRIEEAGLRVARVICLVDRQEGGDEALTAHGLCLESIITRKELSES